MVFFAAVSSITVSDRGGKLYEKIEKSLLIVSCIIVILSGMTSLEELIEGAVNV